MPGSDLSNSEIARDADLEIVIAVARQERKLRCADFDRADILGDDAEVLRS